MTVSFLSVPLTSAYWVVNKNLLKWERGKKGQEKKKEYEKGAPS